MDEERVMVPSTLVWALGLEGPPTGTAGPQGEGSPPGRSPRDLVPIPSEDDGIRKPSVKEVLLGHNKTVVCMIWRSSRAGAGLPGEWILQEGPALHTDSGAAVTPHGSQIIPSHNVFSFLRAPNSGFQGVVLGHF